MKSSEFKKFIAETELFKELDDNELALIAQKVEERQYQAGELLFSENNPRQFLFIIKSGEVELFKQDHGRAERKLASFGPHDFIGEGALMDDYPHSTTARAVKKTTALLISGRQFKELFKDYPEIASRILSRVAKVVARRIRQTSARVVDVGAKYISGRTRSEHDLLGDREVPAEYYYGIQTLRALENFNISGIPLSMFPLFVKSLASVKKAAAMANSNLELLDKKIAAAICRACDEIKSGRFHSQFVVDMIQGGAGTSTNMNANEVIANRALELLGHQKGDYEYCHPNNHVNLSQSTNDVYPTSLKIAIINSNEDLIEVLKELVDAFRVKADEFANVIKMGRTQLQDAVPMTLGRAFRAYAVTLSEEIERLTQNAALFLEINLGGTAIGTGINADPRYSTSAVTHLRKITGLDLKIAPDLVEATQDTGAFVIYSSAIKRLAVKLSKISNDLRLLSSGPRAGINEINLPRMQPGSTIMPGKVNPVIPEVVNQICFKVIGNDLTVTLAAEAGQLELNAMEPIIAFAIFDSIEMLKNGMRVLKHRCVEGITANIDRCRTMVENSIGLVTALSPVLGYEKASQLAQEALEKNKGVYELVLSKKLLSKDELDRLLSPENMVKPMVKKKKPTRVNR